MKSQLSRRALLRGAGGIAIGLPWLQVMGKPQSAHAQAMPGLTEEGVPKRFIVFFSPNGFINSEFIDGSGPNFTLKRVLAPLEPLKDRMTVIRGLHQNCEGGDGHQNGMAGMLTSMSLITPGPFNANGQSSGWSQGQSVDQRMAEVLGTNSPFRSLELGVNVGRADNWGRMSYLGRDQPVTPEEKPEEGFKRIFGNFAGVPGASPEDAEKQLARRKTILDSVKTDFTTLNARLGIEDRAKLEAHLNTVREIEGRLGARARLATESCVDPKLTGPSGSMPEVGRLQMDLLRMALACDQTRIGSIQWTRSVSGARFPFAGVDDNHHSLSHEPDSNNDAVEKLIKIETWYAEQLLYLAESMDAIPEGDGTMLDNSVILWCNELARGNSHSRQDSSYVLLGSAGGAFPTGRALVYEGKAKTPHGNMLLSLLHAMGVEDTSFGNPEWCEGPLDGFA